MENRRKIRISRLPALVLALCLLLPGQAALAEAAAFDEPVAAAAEEAPPAEPEAAAPAGETAGAEAEAEADTEADTEASLQSILSDFAFYIAPPEAEGLKIADPDYRQDFFFDQTLEDTDGTWSYDYDKQNTEYPFTLTLKEGFCHSFAIFNNTTGPAGKPFRIIVEGAAVFTQWLADEEAEAAYLCAAHPVYVSGGKLTIESFTGAAGGYLCCSLVAEEGAHIDLPNGVELNNGSLWAQGGTVTVENGRGEEAAVTAYNANLLFCYVDDRWDTGKIVIDGQGKPAAEFVVNDKYAMGDVESPLSNECITGLEVENIKLVGREGERLYLGNKHPGILSIYRTGDPESALIDKQQAGYVVVTNSKETLPDKNQALTIIFSNGQGEFFSKEAKTGLMMALPEYSMSLPKGKKFKCWSIDGVEIDYTSKQPRWYRWMFPASTTVQAVFADERPVGIRFDANGGTLNYSWRQTVNGKLEFPLPYPYREGYDFIGYFTEKEGGEEITPEMEFWGENTVVVYAHWKERTGDGGAFYGTQLTWTLRDSTIELAGSGAVPEMSWAPWDSMSGQPRNITGVSIGPGVTSVPTQIFQQSYSLEQITVDAGNPAYSAEGGVLYSKDKTQLLYCPVNLQGESFTLPASVTEANTPSLAISKNLTHLDTAPGNRVYFSQDGVLYAHGEQGDVLCVYPLQTETSYAVLPGTAEIGGYAFYSSQLSQVSLPDSVTKIGPYAFGYCKDLEKISLPDGVTALEDFTFYYCEGLREIRLPQNLQSIGRYAFRFCQSLEEVPLPETLRSIAMHAFDGCAALKEISLPEGLARLEDNAFTDCTSLAHVQIPSTLRSGGWDVFSGCTALEGIVIPDGTRPGEMLRGCPNLKYAILGENATNLDTIFGDCAPSLVTLVTPDYIRMKDGAKFAEHFPQLEHFYYCGSQDTWDSRTAGWNIPDSVQVHLDSWFDLIAAEDLGGTAQVYLANNLIFPDYPTFIDKVSFFLAAYDKDGRMLCAQLQEAKGSKENGLLTFTLPVPLSKCARIAAFAVQPLDGSVYSRPAYAPLAAPCELLL